ncbi:hypothetical protein O3P69_014738 [Scylla paramamosain]|uniref:Uncharacterized protein n=1 Tax=Scylla paramamosain TaxID=85552 RepID=A0AAW0TXZ9_SCYPA
MEFMPALLRNQRAVEDLMLKSDTEFWWRNQEPIGGEGAMVEIGSHLFVKVEEEQEVEEDMTYLWLFGGMEHQSKKVFAVPLDAPPDENIDKDTRIRLICQYIRPGSVVFPYIAPPPLLATGGPDVSPRIGVPRDKWSLGLPLLFPQPVSMWTTHLAVR